MVLPLSLKLRNFLSYRENVPTLHLEDVHVACLCGANGHGKSALLDAMTWVLWGRARGQRQEQLLHQGSHEMVVEMEFEARSQRYRITRRFSLARRQGASSLELAVASGDDYRAITSDTIAKTEAFVSQLIGMDYVTFVNSAFLLQGRADRFTMSAPAERKDVLARVLDLGLYDRLEERAKDRAREVQTRLAAMSPTLERLEQQASGRQELAKSLDQTAQQLASSQQSVASLEERLSLLRGHLSRLERLQQEAQELAVQVQRVESRRREAGDEVDSLRRRLATWREVTQQALQIDAGYGALTGARQRLLGLQATARQHYVVEQQLFPLQQRIAQARATLEGEIKAQERELQDLEPRAQALPPLAEAVRQADGLLAALPSKAAEIALLADRQRSAALQARRLEDDNARIAKSGRDIRAKLDLLDHSHPDGVRCPLCDTPLEPEAKARIEQAFHQEIETHRRQYQEQASQIKVLDQEAARLQAQMVQLQRELDVTRQLLLTHRAQVSAQHEQALQAQGRLGESRSGLAKSSKTLEEGRYAQEEQAQSAILSQRLEAMTFHPDDLVKAEQDVQGLERWEGAYRRLEEARARMQEDEESLAKADGRSAEGVEELGRLSERRAKLQRDVADLPVYQARLGELEMEHGALTKERDQLQERRAVLTHQLAEAERAAKDLQHQRAEQQALAQRSGAYAELAQAFGKGGVQALLIEAAIPRLQDETNRLLHRMTDGRMSIKIETQRDRRGAAGRDAGSVETLDIFIADELGTRSYEMFSGGESFRVNFALRIALSKLLAWRAGAPLPTLFIDEGFGTQDAEGRDRILDVIRSIEPDFQRILVITHLDEIKEAFPVRIEVTRTASAGSTFAVA